MTPVVGVTGLPCSGKSLAASMLADGMLGEGKAIFLKADDIGHAVLLRPEVVAKLADRLGADVLRPDPTETRRAIAEKVFHNPGSLAWLEALIHPLVLEEVDKAVASRDGRPVVMEAALLFGSGMESRCEHILLIESPFEVRLQRAAARGWDRVELERREKRQLPLFAEAVKGPYCERIIHVVNNNGPEALRDTLRQAVSTV
ncbi:MAG: dephospho-CoA kinase [Planctomycetaceae bacterium]|nr:dephospho-CoA kinase [Planctomycetaceae bacterium]